MAQSIGHSWPAAGPRSAEAEAFWMQHGELLTQITNVIGTAAVNKDGATLLLMEASLRGLCDQILDLLAKSGIRFVADSEAES